MITNTTAKSTYTVTSGVTEYAIGFDYKTNPDSSPQIRVCVNKHLETQLTYGEDYTLSADGLSIVLISGAEDGDRIDILRDIPMVQLSDYIIGRIDPNQIESDFDEVVMRDQQLEGELEILQEVPAGHEIRILALEEEMDDVTDTLSSHTANVSNPHSVTKAQVGLGNCDNTSDLDKPVSTAAQTALNLKANSADLATVATSGSYNDLLNKPTIPSGQIQSDWEQSDNTAVDYIKNKPTLGTAAAAATTDFATAAQGALADTAIQPSDLATVATTGAYSDLTGTPTIPAAQVNADWNSNSGVSEILNKPSFATVATSGAYSDLTGTPSIPSSINDLSDVTVSTPSSGQFLMYDGSKWANTTSTAAVAWGGITGTLSSQTDLQTALDAKSSNTNCITAISQDINLELSNGTLTLKQGSKYHTPYGLVDNEPKFITLTAAADTTTTLSTDGVYFIYVSLGSNLGAELVSTAESGPSAVVANGLAYDTTTNKIQRYLNNALQETYISFPIAIVTVSGGAIASIDQVFNGFGYIGSTVFALPGIKGLLPDGFNSDGTIKNTSVENTAVKTVTSLTINGTYVIGMSASGAITTFSSGIVYDAQSNKNTPSTVIPVGSVQISSNKISSFTSSPVFCSAVVAEWNIPDYANVINNVGYPYTPTVDGVYLVYTDAGTGSDAVTLDGVTFDILGPYSSVRVPVSAGTVCSVTGSISAYAKFIPFKGA